jgi:hypothetical protein
VNLCRLYQFLVGRNDATSIDTPATGGVSQSGLGPLRHCCTGASGEQSLDDAIVSIAGPAHGGDFADRHAVLWIGTYEFKHCLDCLGASSSMSALAGWRALAAPMVTQIRQWRTQQMAHEFPPS